MKSVLDEIVLWTAMVSVVLRFIEYDIVEEELN